MGSDAITPDPEFTIVFAALLLYSELVFGNCVPRCHKRLLYKLITSAKYEFRFKMIASGSKPLSVIRIGVSILHIFLLLYSLILTTVFANSTTVFARATTVFACSCYCIRGLFLHGFSSILLYSLILIIVFGISTTVFAVPTTVFAASYYCIREIYYCIRMDLRV